MTKRTASSLPSREMACHAANETMSTHFRGSLTARRIGAILLALLILGYLIGITYWRFEELRPPRSLAVLSGLWLLGILALGLLARAWRRN